MAKVKIELNHAGIEELLNGPEVSEMVGAKARQIAQIAGTGYAAETGKVKDRVRGQAYTETEEAMLDNLENNTLLKATGASGWDKEG